MTNDPVVRSGAGCLVIVFNYTGDRLNFGRAVAQATQAGTQVAEPGTRLRDTDTECRGQGRHGLCFLVMKSLSWSS